MNVLTIVNNISIVCQSVKKHVILNIIHSVLLVISVLHHVHYTIQRIQTMTYTIAKNVQLA